MIYALCHKAATDQVIHHAKLAGKPPRIPAGTFVVRRRKDAETLLRAADGKIEVGDVRDWADVYGVSADWMLGVDKDNRTHGVLRDDAIVIDISSTLDRILAKNADLRAKYEAGEASTKVL